MSELVSFLDYTDEVRTADKTEDRGKTDYHKFKTGKNTIRILPAVDSDAIRSPFAKGWVHWFTVEGNNGPRQITFTCNHRTHGGECVACAFLNIKMAANKATQDDMKSLKPSRSIRAIVIDRDDPSPRPLICTLPVTVFNAIQEALDDEEEEDRINLTHPLKGHDIRVTKKVENGKTSYIARLAKNPTPLIAKADGTPDVDAINEILTGKTDPSKGLAPANGHYVSLAAQKIDPYGDVGKQMLQDGSVEMPRQLGTGSSGVNGKRKARQLSKDSDVDDEFESDDSVSAEVLAEDDWS